MLEKGHVFVYGTSGVCRVDEIKICDYGAGKKEYYILQPVFDMRSSLSVPVDSPMLSNHSRELLSEEEILKILDSVPKESSDWNKNDKERIETSRKILENDSFSEIVLLLRSIYIHKKELLLNGKKLRSSDESIMQRAEKLIFGEFAWVCGKDPKEAALIIKEKIE